MDTIEGRNVHNKYVVFNVLLLLLFLFCFVVVVVLFYWRFCLLSRCYCLLTHCYTLFGTRKWN